MIVRKSWKNEDAFRIREYTGFFLFGIFPIYIVRNYDSRSDN